MLYLDTDNVIYFDCDNTCIMHDYREEDYKDTIVLDNWGTDMRVFPNKFTIEALKNHHAKGHKVIVWSYGGSKWAREVVRGLGLEEFVDVVMCKPIHSYYDDLPAREMLDDTNRFDLCPYTGKNKNEGSYI